MKRIGTGVVVTAAMLVAWGIGAQPAPGAAAPTTVGEWRFDETAGQTAIDGGPYGLDGRLGSTDEADAADPARIQGALGGALRFNGASFVRLPDASALDVPLLTAEAVVRAPASPGQFRYLVSRGGERCFAGSYGVYTGAAEGIAVYVFDGSHYVVSATARPADVWDGRWHHVAGTFDGQQLRLFLDGRPVGAPAWFPTGIDYTTSSTSAFLGRYAGSCELAFQGDLDLVRLWSGALSPSAVADAARRDSEAGGGAPVPTDLDTPLPAAAPPTMLPPGRLGTSSSGGTRPAAAPGAPPRACVLRASRRRIVAKRRNVVRVHARLRGRPLRATRVTARWRGTSRVLTEARTGAQGRVRLVIRVRRTGSVRISAARARPRCSPVDIRVKRSGSTAAR